MKLALLSVLVGCEAGLTPGDLEPGACQWSDCEEDRDSGKDDVDDNPDTEVTSSTGTETDPATEPDDGIFIASDSQVRFASQGKAIELLNVEDVYTDSLSRWGLQFGTHTSGDVTVADYLAFLVDHALGWTADEENRLRPLVESAAARLISRDLPFPQDVWLVQLDDGDAPPFTRENYIILPPTILSETDSDIEELILHELFHILSRGNPTLRDDLYSIIGFYPCLELEYPPSILDLKMTNPDSPVLEHCVDLESEFWGTYPYMPITYATGPYTEGTTSPFDVMTFELLGVEIQEANARSAALYMEDGSLYTVDPFSSQEFWGKVGRNTQYILHPEEIMADNFAYLMLGSTGLQDSWIQADMESTLP